MIIGRNETNIHINLLFVLADVMDTLVLDLNQMLKKEGVTLKHETKRDFNALMKSVKNLRSTIKFGCQETRNDYANDSDRIYEYIKLLIDRVGTNDLLFYNLYQKLYELESTQNMKNLNLSVFDDVECELDSKIQRHISMAKEVFQVDDIKKRFCKKAYYARLVIVRSLTLDGLTPKYIADGLGLTERTVKRLIVESQRALVDREDYKLMINEFYKQYYEKKAS
jgi:hypothetical protein